VGLVGEAGTAIVEVAEGATATFTAATFAGATVGDIVINGTAEFGAAAVPGGDVTVGAKGDVTLKAAAAPAGDVTVGGTLTINADGSLVVKSGKTLDLAGGRIILKGGGSAGGTLQLSDTSNKTAKIAAATTASAANAVTDAVLTTSGSTATITVAAASTADTSVAGTSAISTNATTITTGTNKAITAATATFASATAVVAKTDTVVPAAAGFGVGVTISNGAITTNETSGAWGS
jgi:hypothetical protein